MVLSLDYTKIVVFVSKLTDLSEGSAFNTELMEDQCNTTDRGIVALRDLFSTNTVPIFTTTEKIRNVSCKVVAIKVFLYSAKRLNYLESERYGV